MGKVYFLFGVHNHQPVGNFDHVFKYAYDRCYLPFISLLEEFPRIKCSIHNSGPLYDWFGKNAPRYFDILKKLVKRGQVEVVSGGYYEPIFSLISDEDKNGQITLMNDFIKQEFKQEPKGIWLAERVWEPYLPRIIQACGLQYTFLDDTHFRCAGFGDKEFFGYYTTEDEGKPIFVFPISKTLRYKIPFSQAHEAAGILNEFGRNTDSDILITFFDDGEKFGLWPHTFEWVYEKEWLRKFFSLLQESSSIEMIFPREAVNKFSSSGIVYLPTASYEEMGEWVLEPQAFSIYEDLNKFLKEHNKFDEYKDFIRGGFFRNFYRKYPRLNYMHKRMVSLSKKIYTQASPKKDKAIFTDLWKAQTNCGYWHGIFGGFYLSHIRGAVYENLINAQNLFDKKYTKQDIIVEEEDIDLDGNNEIFIRNKGMIYCFSPKGGALIECSLRNPPMNLLNTITRREESYHAKIRGNVNKVSGVVTIHDMVVQKEKDLDKYLIYDKYERLGLIDHLLDKNLTIDDFNSQKGVFTLSNNIYNISIKKGENKVDLDCRYNRDNLSVSKRVEITSECGFEAAYKIVSSHKKNNLNNYNFGIEFNLALPSPNDIFKKEDKSKIPLCKPGSWCDIDEFIIIDLFKKTALEFKFDKADVFNLPVYSISSSESGFEKVYQEIAVLFIVKGKRENFKIKFSLRKL